MKRASKLVSSPFVFLYERSPSKVFYEVDFNEGKAKMFDLEKLAERLDFSVD